MLTERLLEDEAVVDTPPANSSRPSPHDSSQLLLGLMTLHKRADELAPSTGNDPLSGIISKGVLRSLMSALYFRDAGTVRHSRRVAMLSTGIAKHLGWEAQQITVLEVAALLHDIGKIGVPDNILFKAGKLSPDESELMNLHCNIGADVLQACRVHKDVVKFIAQGAEHFHGYIGRTRTVGTNVCQEARILAVADAYDSLSADKSYRKAQPHARILEILKAASGSQFDGNIVRALERWSECEPLPLSDSCEDLGQAGSSGPLETTHEAGALGHIFSYLYLLESLYDGFYLIDSQFRFVIWNRGAENFLGRNAHDVLDQTWTDMPLRYADHTGENLEDLAIPIKMAIESGLPVTQAVQMETADGRWIPVEVQSVPLFDSDGQLQGVAEICRDLSRNSVRPREYRELRLAASRDPLTGLANRGELETQLALMVDEQQSPGAEPFSAIFADVDHFKEINDVHGHTIGDQVLVEVAKCLQEEISSGDLVARYGGEEFVILCAGTDLEQGVKRAERLRLSIIKRNIGKLPDLFVTASFGVTRVESGDTVEAILQRADRAQYDAKKAGRNRTVSLTSAEILAAEAAEKCEAEAQADPFVCETTFRACIAAGMIVYKLGGFVRDEHGALTEVTPTRAVIHLGRSVLPLWGWSPEWQPVRVVVEFKAGKAAPSRRERVASKQVAIKVRVEPLGWVRSSEAFQKRAAAVLRTLRSYFAAG